jgi:hypothetical protein
MNKTHKESKTIDLSEVKSLNLIDDGRLSIVSDNCLIVLVYYHGKFSNIKFSIENPKFKRMSVSSVVEDITDDEVIIKVQAVQQDLAQKQTEHDISDITDLDRHFKTQNVDLRKIDRIDLRNEGKILISGDNSRLLLGFHDCDFTFIKFTIEDVKLNKMLVSDIIDDSIHIKVLDPNYY